MTLYFITGNEDKFKEVEAIIPSIEKIDLDLPEIQDLDSKKVIEEKLREATKNHDGEFFCEYVSVNVEALNGFPGPLIKWFLQSLGNEGICELVDKYENKSAVAKTIIGYTNGKEIQFFEGELKGKITEPKGTGFGWDPIFQPNGFDKTLGEMSPEEKNKISMRKIALEKLKDYLHKSRA